MSASEHHYKIKVWERGNESNFYEEELKVKNEMGSFSVAQDSQVPVKTGTSEPPKPKEEEKKRDDQKNSWVINWVPNQRGSFGIYRLAKSDSTQRGTNHWSIYAHGVMGGGFRVQYKNGNYIDVFRAQQIIVAITKISKTFETKLKSPEGISIKFVVCNERRNSSDEGLIKTIKKLTILYPHITAEVSSGLV